MRDNHHSILLAVDKLFDFYDEKLVWNYNDLIDNDYPSKHGNDVDGVNKHNEKRIKDFRNRE